MSEFSDCYYAYQSNVAALSTFLKGLKRYSLILPTSGNWTPFLVDYGPHGLVGEDEVLAKYREHLLRYYFGEDYGLSLQLYYRSQLKVEISINRDGGSDIDVRAVQEYFSEAQILDQRANRLLADLLMEYNRTDRLDLYKARTELAGLLGLELYSWLGCADLSHVSTKLLKDRFPHGIFLLTSKRGKVMPEIAHTPNRWCPEPNQPFFMYLPVPSGEVNEDQLDRHCDYWIETGDFNNEQQTGYWMLNAYYKALPYKYRYLANRVMNVNSQVFKDGWKRELRRTITGILSVSSANFDWAPYLSRQKGGERL